MKDQIDFVYAAGETRRFHSWPVLRSQNVADHSWHVAMLLHVLYGQDEPGIRPALLMAALCHDAAECKFGDMPAPAKRELGERLGKPDFREIYGQMEEAELSKYGLDWDALLDDEERRKLKFCDALEGAFYCIRERHMGNKLIAAPFLNFAKYIDDVISEPEDVKFNGEPKTVSDREWEIRSIMYAGWARATECE